MKNKILFLLVGMFLISFSLAWSEDKFNNSLTTENLTFGGDENITRWLSVPVNTILTDAMVNLSGLSRTWNLSDTILINNISEGGTDLGLFFKPDGTKMYRISNNRIDQFTLSTSWDISTAVEDYTTPNFLIKGTQPTGIFFKSDGTRLYSSSFSSATFHSYTLSQAWNLSTIVYDGISISGTSNQWDLFFKPDGTKMYEATTNNIYEWDLSQAWNLSTATYNGISISRQGADGSTGFYFSPNGDYLFESGHWEDNVYKYTLSQAWNLSTATYINFVSTTKDDLSNLFFKSDGTKFYTLKYGSIWEYDIKNYTTSPSIHINNTKVWNHTGEFNTTIQTNNLAETINNYIKTATATAGYYLIPFIFHSDTVGILKYFNLIFNNEGFLENSQTYQTETTEGNIETFKINFSYDSDEYSSVEAIIFYDGTGYIASKESNTGNDAVYSANVPIPSVSTDENKTFYWNILVDTISQNSTSNNQTVYNLAIDDCSSYSNYLLNMTIYDEETQTILSGTDLEVAVNIYSSDGETLVLNLSGEYATNPTAICLNKNLTESSNYLMNVMINYEATGHANEYYNIVGLTLTNDTEMQEISLYDLNATDSTDFQLTFKGEDFLPVEDALVYIERQYISENTFKTVELPKTDSNGQTVLHLVRNDVLYNIRVIKDGVVLGNFLNIVAFCQDFTIGDCSINLNAQGDSAGAFDYDQAVGIMYSSPPTYNNDTNKISFGFTSTDGTTKTVLMNVERRDIFGNRSVCDNTVISTSGTVSCDIGAGSTETSLVTIISVDGEEWIVDTVTIERTNYGNIGFIVWFVMALSLILMFSESKNGIMISIAISYIGAVTLGLSVGGVTGVGSAGIWVLVMTVVGIWKINKNRTN